MKCKLRINNLSKVVIHYLLTYISIFIFNHGIYIIAMLKFFKIQCYNCLRSYLLLCNYYFCISNLVHKLYLKISIKPTLLLAKNNYSAQT